jgi:uridine kinase
MNSQSEVPNNPSEGSQLSRIVIVGCPSAGKSTLAKLLGAALCLPVVRRDDLGELGSEGYRDAIHTMVDTPAWILDGPPFFEEEIVYQAADFILWLDTPKSSVIWWGLKRAFAEARDGDSLMHALHRTGGPVYAMYAFASRRAHFTEVFANPAYKGKVGHIKPNRFVYRLPDIDRLVKVLRKTNL